MPKNDLKFIKEKWKELTATHTLTTDFTFLFRVMLEKIIQCFLKNGRSISWDGR